MRSLYGVLIGALAAAAAYLYFGASDEARAATGNEPPGEVFDPESNVRPPNKPPEGAGVGPFSSFQYWIPGQTGGEPISSKVKELIDPRVGYLEPTITTAADWANVPTDLLAVVLHRESRGDLTAVGDGGDSLGAGQVQKEAANTVNDYFGTDLDRENWIENIYLTAGYLSFLHSEMYSNWWPGTGRPLNLWYHATRGYLCGKKGAEENAQCASAEAKHRIATAQLQSQLPSS
jgi:hypothetical protein